MSQSKVDIENSQTQTLYKCNSTEIFNRPSVSKTKTLIRSTAPHKQYIPPLPFVTRSTTAQKIHIPKPAQANIDLSKPISNAVSLNNLRIGNAGQTPIFDYEHRFLDNSKDFLSLDNLNLKDSAKQPKLSPRRTPNDDCVLSVLATPTESKSFKMFTDKIDQTLGIPLSPPTTTVNYSRHWPPFSSGNDFNYNPVFQPSAVFHNHFTHPLIAGNIPSMIPTSPHKTANDCFKVLPKKEFNSILSTNSTNNTKKEEKNKVKFSDTVQIAVVPELPRKEKINMIEQKIKKYAPDPEKELAESLPLSHPDDYLSIFSRHPNLENEASQSLNMTGN